MPPRTVFFAGKAAPAYTLAKLIIHLINNVAAVIDADPAVRGRLKVLFLPEYNVTLAQRLIPASDVSEQISTAGFEASGTSNMKFMMNGALTVGTRDGATIEMAEAAGEENFFLFGLTAEQVRDSRGWYDPRWHYENEPETRRALDLIRSGAFDRGEPGVFGPICDALLTHGDYYMHLADLSAYVADPGAVGRLYRAARRLGAPGDRQRGPLRQVLQRPHDRGVRGATSGGRSPARWTGREPWGNNEVGLLTRHAAVDAISIARPRHFRQGTRPCQTRTKSHARVTKVLVQALGVEEDDIKPSATLKGDLGAESIDFLDIVFRLEREFVIKIRRDELFAVPVFQGAMEIVQDGRVTDEGLAALRCATALRRLEGAGARPAAEPDR